ncbi:PDZ domain-containing protein [Schlesneria sp. T3-172]|uniref:PDZ domain-containing protein n=1 Tax=Schlesneria sphaerica TaxID=3373610 RepID=UPI0037CAB706
MGAGQFNIAVHMAMLLSILTGSHQSAFAQTRERLDKSDAPLVVEGVVRQVFKSPRQGRTDYLVQVDVQKSEGRTALKKGEATRFAGPGESVYIHISQRLDPSGKVIASESFQGPPEERAQIKAFLTAREQGGWEGSFPDWYEVAGERGSFNPADDSASISLDDLPAAAEKSQLGMTSEVIKIQNRIALRVRSVERSGPAQKAGLEVGDIIAGIDGEAIKSPGQLETFASQGKKFSLVVVDVNTGKKAQIEIDPHAATTSDREATSETAEKPATQPGKISLGISAEPVTLGTRSALKVTGVKPESPAGKAGLEVGDIIVSANGAPLTGPEQLLAALRKSGPTLKLAVRDSRTGRDAEVTVNLGGTPPIKSFPADVESSTNSVPGKLGAVTELAFHDDDFAVKVTEVEPGSAAARAGLKPGVLILAANGKAVLHPNDLNDAVHSSKGILKLTILNPSGGKKTTLDVDLRN